MPYFIKIGRFRSNKTGIGARGWHIWRRGSSVQWEFGPVEVRNGIPKRILWAAGPWTDGPQRFRSVAAAKHYMRDRIDMKERGNTDGSYQRLPPGSRIIYRP